MKWAFRGALAVIIVAVAVWAWLTFFPGPEHAIRKRLGEVAQLASFSGREGELAIPINAQKLTSFFTPDAEISVDVPELRQKFSGQDQLFKAAMAVRSTLLSLKVEMLDINITFAPDKTSAVANVTLKVRANGDRDFVPQEVKFTLKKVKGQWLIQEAETVRTLSHSFNWLNDFNVDADRETPWLAAPAETGSLSLTLRFSEVPIAV
jgi:hypothetical protein